jgi:WD40 repeat protein/serine/threonine protein kinase
MQVTWRRSNLPRRTREAYGPPMEFRVLGPLEVAAQDGPIALGGPKQRAVLANLIIRANQLVPADALIDLVWEDEPPESARNVLQTYVSHLRKALGPGRLEGRAPGYILHLDRAELDARRFEDLLHEARSLNGQADRAAPLLGEALDLWRGPAFADLSTEEALRGEITRLEDLRLQALEERIGADIECGSHLEVLGELETRTREHPLRERLWAELILALYRSGRQTDALAAYQRLRDVLAEELGVDPSRDLQTLYERILRQDPDLNPKGEPLRGYRLLEPVGEGAFGVVYRATQPQIGREVAIKAVHPELANHPDFVRRFEHEAQIVARLEHPHIVPLYDYWREPDGAYLVMRFLRGGSLEDLVALGPLPPERAAAILDQTAAALGAAHRQGVVHRDVKPGNVLLDDEGNAYLTDFGVALDAGAPERTSGTMMRGTPAYLSPEQIRLETATPQSDVYALGVVLYEMLTGEHPFPEGSLTTLLDRHLRDPLPSVRVDRPDLPDDIDAVIARATAKEATARFADPLQVATAFRTALEGSPAAVEPAREIRNPYKGLRAFREADAADFFGRETVTERLVRRLEEQEQGARFLAVVGPSGSGKSSVVRAGLVPALRRGALPGSEHWFVIDLLPGNQPFRELESALLGVSVEPPPSLLEDLRGDPRGLVRAADRVLPDPDSELLVVLDQLEEVFTLVEDDDERARLLESLEAAALDPDSRVRVVTTLRADFFDAPLSLHGFGRLLADRTEAIPSMSPEELERAIVAPADRAGLAVEPRLVAAMVADVVDRSGALPLLQYALTELAERRTDGMLTLEGYRRIGGVAGALARRAEQLYEAKDERAQQACRQMFLRLVTLGEGGEDTRRRVLRSELIGLSNAAVMDGVIESYGRHRLLSFDRDPSSREPTVEIAHESLLGVWARLRGWVDEARDDIRTQRRLSAAASEWESSGREQSFLLTGTRLDQTATWAETTGIALSGGDADYLSTSIARRDRERTTEAERQARERVLERRSVRRLRGGIAALTAAVLVASVLTAISLNQRGLARGAARMATARELAQAAMANIDVDEDRSLLLAVQAVETTYRVDATVLPQAEEALHASLQAHRLLFSVPGYQHVDFSPDGTRLVVGGIEGEVNVYEAATGADLLTVQDPRGESDAFAEHDVAFSPDGSSFASSSGMVWDAVTGEPIQHLELGSGYSIAYSPDGKLLASDSPEGGTGIWDLETGELANRFDAFGGVVFSPKGRRMLIADNYGDPDPDRGQIAGYIVDPRHEEGSDPVTLFGHQDTSTRGADWSPDGSMVATSAGPEVLVWDAKTAERTYSLTASSRFATVAFSPDSSGLATGMWDGTTIVWQLGIDGAQQVLTVAGHDAVVTDVAFSPDGKRLATASVDGAVNVWDVTPGGSHEWLAVPGAQGLAYSPDGSVLATTSTAEETPRPQTIGAANIHLWDAVAGRPLGTLRGHRDEIIALDFALEGNRVASASLDGTARIWNTREDVPPVILDDRAPGQTRFVVEVSFSPDGKTVATSHSDGGSIRLWDATTGEQLTTFHDESGDPVPGNWRVDFSPDGKILAAPSDGNLFVWDVSTGEVVAHRTVPAIGNIAFSPDGQRLLGIGGDGVLHVWDTQTWRERATVEATAADVQTSPVENLAATVDLAGMVRLWQIQPLREILVVSPGPSGYIGPDGLAFSPDGTRLAVDVGDTVRVYALDIDDLIGLARDRATRGFTDQECRQYLHLERCPEA